jgi:hypothetical protein
MGRLVCAVVRLLKGKCVAFGLKSEGVLFRPSQISLLTHSPFTHCHSVSLSHSLPLRTHSHALYSQSQPLFGVHRALLSFSLSSFHSYFQRHHTFSHTHTYISPRHTHTHTPIVLSRSFRFDTHIHSHSLAYTHIHSLTHHANDTIDSRCASTHTVAGMSPAGVQCIRRGPLRLARHHAGVRNRLCSTRHCGGLRRVLASACTRCASLPSWPRSSSSSAAIPHRPRIRRSHPGSCRRSVSLLSMHELNSLSRISELLLKCLTSALQLSPLSNSLSLSRALWFA